MAYKDFDGGPHVDHDPIFIFDSPHNELNPGEHSVSWFMRKNGVLYCDSWIASSFIKARQCADFQIAAVVKRISEQSKNVSRFTTQPT